MEFENAPSLQRSPPSRKTLLPGEIREDTRRDIRRLCAAEWYDLASYYNRLIGAAFEKFQKITFVAPNFLSE